MKLPVSQLVVHAGQTATGPSRIALDTLLATLRASTPLAERGAQRVRADLPGDDAIVLADSAAEGLPGSVGQGPSLQADGFEIRELAAQKAVLIRGGSARGLLYAVRKFARESETTGGVLEWKGGNVREAPAYQIRSWAYYDVASSLSDVCQKVLPTLAQDLRLNAVMYSTFKKGTIGPQVFLDGVFPAHRNPFAAASAQILAARQDLLTFTRTALEYGLDVYAGWGALDFPEYFHEFVVEHYPELIARAYQGSSDWPPYEWQERPKFCPSSSLLWTAWQSAVDEFLTLHPELTGIVFSFYDGNPIGCGCAKCAGYSYGDRYRDAVVRTNEVVLKHGKRMIIFDWLPGALSAKPGYGHFWDASKDYIDSHDNILMASWETAGDFCMGHPPNPVVGRYRNQMAGFQLWPEYRGWGKVPDWIVRHMSSRFRQFRSQKLQGYFAIEGNMDDRVNAVNFHAFGALCWNPLADPVSIERSYCEQEFGKGGAPLADILAKSFDCRKDYLYVHDVKFNGHSHLEYDLRTWESVYVRYDSGAFFPDLDERLDASMESIAGILGEKDRGVTTAVQMLRDFRGIMDGLAEPDRQLIGSHLERNLHYSRLWRGFARAFFHLKRLKAEDAAIPRDARAQAAQEIRRGCAEMLDAYSQLPTVPPTGKRVYYEQGFPWSSPELQDLIRDLQSTAEIHQAIESGRDLRIVGGGLSAQYLEHLFLPFDLAEEGDGLAGESRGSAIRGLGSRKVVVIDRYATSFFNRNAQELTRYLENGGTVLLHDPDCRTL